MIVSFEAYSFSVLTSVYLILDCLSWRIFIECRYFRLSKCWLFYLKHIHWVSLLLFTKWLIVWFEGYPFSAPTSGYLNADCLIWKISIECLYFFDVNVNCLIWSISIEEKFPIEFILSVESKTKQIVTKKLCCSYFFKILNFDLILRPQVT